MNPIRNFITIAAIAVCGMMAWAENPYSDAKLRQYAAEMLMVGFKADSITPDCDAVRYVRDLHVGGVILFDVDLTGSRQIGSRNITSRERLRTLTRQLQRDRKSVV